MPATVAVSLTAIGTPAKGRSSPGPTASAAARAPSGSRWTKAFRSLSSASMRSSAASASSRALTSPLRTSRASCPAGLVRRSPSTGLAKRRLGAVQALARVLEDRHPALGRLRVADAAPDHGVEDLLAEALAQRLQRLARVDQPHVGDVQDDAEPVEVGVERLLRQLHHLEGLLHALQREVLGL